jgi:Ni/Co efflux regulator RcnB
MRTVMIAAALLGLATTDAAPAGAAKRHRVVQAATARPAVQPDAYRRPTRGWALPAYWQSPRYAVADWRALGLREPLPGYRWMRYHGDAVLVDRNYSIFDVALEVDRRGSDPFYANDDGCSRSRLRTCCPHRSTMPMSRRSRPTGCRRRRPAMGTTSGSLPMGARW